MSKGMPPVPPAGRSRKGPGVTQSPAADQARAGKGAPDNTDEQDRQGNIKQNTTNQGYQQDR